MVCEATWTVVTTAVVVVVVVAIHTVDVQVFAVVGVLSVEVVVETVVLLLVGDTLSLDKTNSKCQGACGPSPWVRVDREDSIPYVLGVTQYMIGAPSV